MKTAVQLLLTVLVTSSAYAKDVVQVAQVQPTLPAQPSGVDRFPKPDPVRPPSTAKESPKSWNGLTLAIGLGYGIPFGGIIDDSMRSRVDIYGLAASTSVGDKVSGQAPFSLSLAYRPIPVLSIGIATAWAPLFVRQYESSAGSGSNKRLGGEVRVQIPTRQSFSPWVSAGIGYEWFEYRHDPWDGSYLDVSASGFDWDLQVGGDVALANSWTIGPYAELAAGSFRHLRAKCGSRSCATGPDFDLSEADRTTHGWLTFGVRGTFPIFAR